MKSSKQGSVLVITLFVLFFMAAMALMVSYNMRLEITLINRYIQRLRSFYIARGAMWLAIEELKQEKTDNEFDSFKDSWCLKFQDDESVAAFDFLNKEGVSCGTYKVIITDEMSKININKASLDVISRFLAVFPKINNDKLAREISAYKRIRSQETGILSGYELLRLNSMKSSVFWGEDTNENGILDAHEDDGKLTFPDDNNDGELDLGLKDYFTVHGDGKVNINTASLSVLRSMPAMTEKMALQLIDLRNKKPFEKTDDLKSLIFLSDEVKNKILSWATVRSDIYRICVMAKAKGAKTGRQILAVVDRSGGASKINYWRED